jgi:hypothetical protein
MDADVFTDFATSIRYALTPKAGEGGAVEVVLDLYRGSVPVHTRTVARVAPAQVSALMRTCRRHLERRGAHAVASASADLLEAHVPKRAGAAPPPAPWTAPPVAAFDWMFAG